MGKAYGFFEIPSVTAAVVAVDIMCKTADPQLRRPLKLPSRMESKNQ